MKKTVLFFILFIALNSVLHAQSTQKKSITKLPKSIYTLHYFSTNSVPSFGLQKNIQFSSQDIVFVNFNTLESYALSLNLKDIWTKPYRFVYDDNPWSRKNYLLKDFFKKHDPTRWNGPPHRQ
jgi:hypothetical protein